MRLFSGCVLAGIAIPAAPALSAGIRSANYRGRARVLLGAAALELGRQRWSLHILRAGLGDDASAERPASSSWAEDFGSDPIRHVVDRARSVRALMEIVIEDAFAFRRVVNTSEKTG